MQHCSVRGRRRAQYCNYTLIFNKYSILDSYFVFDQGSFSRHPISTKPTDRLLGLYCDCCLICCFQTESGHLDNQLMNLLEVKNHHLEL